MTVENANAFLDELHANGPSAKLMSRIGRDFQPEHMQEALKSQGIIDEETLKGLSGGNITAAGVLKSGEKWAKQNKRTIEYIGIASASAAS